MGSYVLGISWLYISAVCDGVWKAKAQQVLVMRRLEGWVLTVLTVIAMLSNDM